MSTTRVLFVTHAYPRFAEDAAGSFLHRLALALQAGGTEVRVLAPSGPGLAGEQSIDNVAIRRYRYAPRGMESLAYTGTMAEQVLGTLRGKGALAGLLAAGTMAVRRAVDELKPDIVHAHWWFPSGLLTLGLTDEMPVITTMHGSDVRLARKVKFVHPLFRRVMSHSAGVTAVSSWLAGEARAMAPRARVDVAPMPADTALFGPTREPRKPGAFLFVGRLNAQKGLRDVLEALAWSGGTTSLDVVGDGDDAQALRAQADKLGVASRVRWHGAVNRQALPSLYSRALATIVPSKQEGLGLVAVESQLCGTPVIAYRSGGLPDVVKPESGGSLVPAGDVRALADAMRAHVGDPGRIEGLGAAARATMVDRFAPAKVAQGYRDRYRALLAGTRP
jgi:glycosyltransferase involved in cell wall biosynthesis